MERNHRTIVSIMMLEDIKSFVASFDLPSILSCTQLTGGANNRVYKLTFSDRDPLILKRYFQHPNDPRQRLLAEFSFLQYAWSLGLRCIPEPLYSDKQANVAIYSHLKGRLLQMQDLTEPLIQQTMDFFIKLNANRHSGQHLPTASEGCFSMQEHIETIEKRVNRLQSYDHPALNAFLQQDLLPEWKKIRSTIDLSLDHILTTEERCISPSDFGFHNALFQENGQLAFIDFEYAGWDDPAKTVCDFFCQPRIPVPTRFFSNISQKFIAIASNPSNTSKRIQQLFPCYRIKWCCIILNAFSSIGQTRRTFAQMDEQKEEQLTKAKQLLSQDLPWPT